MLLRLVALVLALTATPCWAPEPAAVSVWAETLIVAANQRILVQKMTKDLVLIANDLDPVKNKADLRATMVTFETDLNALTVGDTARKILPPTAEIVVKDLQKVQDSWAVYKALLEESIDTIRDPATGTFNVTAINLALKYDEPIVKNSEEVVKFLVAQSIVAGEDGSEAALVDICERQLMLIHEVNKEVVLVGMGVDPEYFLQKVLNAMQLFQNSHEGILRGAAWANVLPLREVCILDQMRDVTQDWETLLGKLQLITTSPSPQQAQEKAAELATNLTNSCDKLVGSMTAATYSIAHDKTTCGDMKVRVTGEEWLIAIQSSEAQNFLVAQATQYFMQIALGFEVSQSQVDLTVLTESVGQDLRKLIEGNLAENLVVPPDQAVVDLLFAAQSAWINLELELKKSVRSADIPSTSIKEVARLSRLALDNMESAVKLYVKVALSSGTDAPVYLIDIAAAQRTAIAKMAMQTSLLSYGYDPQNSWTRFNSTRRSFVENHWKLMKGAPATTEYPEVPKTTNVCMVQQMSTVLTAYETLEIAALQVANGNQGRLSEVVQLAPQVVSDMTLAMKQFSGSNTTCGAVSFSKEQWQGLISEVGYLRSLSQQAAVRFLLEKEFNQSTVSLVTKLEESELRIKFGSRDPLVPPPISQEMFDEVAQHLEPKLFALMSALQGSDSKSVDAASLSVTEETNKVKKEFLQDALASNPDKPVLRIDLASQQIMLSYRIFKESLMMKANLNTTLAMLSESIGAFEAAQTTLKEGGGSIPAVIRNRFDIFKQWEQVMTSWSVFKELVLSTDSAITETESALDALVVNLERALELYTIPDEPLRPDTLWPIIAYSAIGACVVFVACCASVVFCRLRKNATKEATAEV